MESATLNKLLRLVLLLELLAAPVAAQTVRADRVTLNAGPCVITSGSAAPNGSRVGNVCDTFIQTTSGAIWTKTSGTGTSSGWIATLAGTGTPGTLPVWTSAGAIGDSIIAQAGGVATITGSATITGTGTMNAASITNNASIGGTATIGTEHVTGSSTIDAALGVGGNTTLGGWIGTASYASQVAGWRITAGGAADVRYLFTDELRAKLFTADAESVLAGSLRVTKSYSTVAQQFTCPAAGGTATLWVYDASTYGDAPVFQSGGASPDWVVMHVLTRSAFGPFTITDCVGTVASYTDGSGANAGQQSWTFTRGAGANGGAMTASTVVAVNQLVQDMGVSGNGYVEMSAVDGANGVNAPYIQTNVWSTSPVAANTATACRLGNLNGITSVVNEYGLVCTRGLLYDPTVASVRLSTTAFQVRNVALDYWNNSTQVLSFDPTAPSLAMGSPIPTAFAGGNAGFWMGRDTADGLYKIRIGNPTGNRLTYANGALAIVGEGSGITNINGGNIQAGTITASQITVTPTGAALNDDPYTMSGGSWIDAFGVGFPATIATITNGVVGGTALRSVAGHSAGMGNAKHTPFDATSKSYRVHTWARSTGASGTLYLGVNAFGGDGAYLTTVWAVSGVTVPTAWTEFSAPLLGVPLNTTSVQVAIDLNWLSSLTPTGYMDAQDIRLEEIVPSTLIKDGAITTAKIQAGAITANQIAARTITVANLNATGFGDNLIKNGTFEGSTPTQQVAGWINDATSVGQMTGSCCGTRGPGILSLAPTAAANYVDVFYLAVPTQPAQPYRVALDVYAPVAVTGGLYVRMQESTTLSPVAPSYVLPTYAGVAPGSILQSSQTDICANCNVPAGWTHLELFYTPPAGVVWISLNIFDNSCASGSSCQPFGFDAIEMQPQIGPGHIRANSITADRLVANSITAAQIAAGTITSAQIAASTITGGNIAGGTITGGNIAGRTISAGLLVANTITSNEIGVRAIVAGNIATGTLTANELAANTITGDRIAAGTIVGGNIAGGTISAYNIQANSITADRLSVSSLSAISANLGTVTAGTINGITITGTTINGGTVNGTAITGGSININSGAFQVDSSGNLNANGTTNIRALNAGYNAGGVSTVNFNGEVYIAPGMGLTINGLGGSGNRLVCTNTNGRLYTSAANGSC